MTHTFVICTQCGHEFQSGFAPVTSMAGAMEPCPKCKEQLASPIVHGLFNFDAIKREFDEPMQRIYPDGEIFMGKGLGLDLGNPIIARFFSSYNRDFRRSLEMLDSFYKSDRSNSRQVLSYIYIQAWAAYEALILALLDALVDANLATSKKGTFEDRQNSVFAALGLFKGFPPSLALLYAQRNCLVHKSGVVDEKLQDVARSLGASTQLVAHLEIGAPLSIDAESAVHILDTVQHAARSVLAAAAEALRV